MLSICFHSSMISNFYKSEKGISTVLQKKKKIVTINVSILDRLTHIIGRFLKNTISFRISAANITITRKTRK